ncbi:DUF6236 family protein (plasmid) [Streptomyces sp. NBC_00513]|uniref:DUF6236 family protein n=1 Tax=unclassified Streptomyces TaxID=2593676 RepID=UPI00224E8D91|nr:DUF6236 family protein [Streptomyces sp. NBC_00424]MCX5078820.1 DUF6236 family protein [Streptomyces sp. NBC_00424]WUD46260.1 DUF6236 family protein [Streptomyces sp. NBC_00513]
MALQTGLYYPYVHLRDESWAKAAALYWRNLARVVPAGFPVRDRAVVRELNQESGFLVDIDPRQAAEAVAPMVVAAVRDNTEALRDRFAARGRALAGVAPRLTPTTRSLTGLYPQEVPVELRYALEEAGLATLDWRRTHHGAAWVAVDPALAWVYKCAVTHELAHRTAFTPVTDQMDAHSATGGWTAERIADVLLDRAAPAVGHETAKARVAMMAVRCVLPADLRHVPVEKIVRLRTQYADEFIAFAAAVDAAAADVLEGAREVTDRGAFELHLQAAFDLHVAQPLESLRKAIHGLKMETISTALTIKPEATVSGAGLGMLFGGTTTAVGAGIAFTALATRQAAARERDTLVASSPAGYLLRVEKELKPTTVLRRATRAVARTAGVGI